VLCGAVVAAQGLSAADKSVSLGPSHRAVGLTNNADDAELEKLMADDDAALAEVDQWIRANDQLASKGSGEDSTQLNKRIIARLGLIRQRYQDFLKHHPKNAVAHLAYGTFLEDTGEEEAAGEEYEIASKLDPTNPATWNNLANYYGERSPVTNAFACYEKAIALDPKEPVYYENFGTTVYLFRKDAKEYYHIDESQVFDKALALYRQAMRLDPTNFVLATDYARSYYGIKPMRTNDALISWTNALKLAQDDLQREGVYIHLARLKIHFARYPEARAHLDAITNTFYDQTKHRLERNLNEALHPSTNAVSTATNAVASTSSVTSGK